VSSQEKSLDAPSLTRSPFSRRVALGAFAASAAALMPAPAWALTDRRPGSAGPPRLSPNDRPVVAQVSAQRAVEHIIALSEGVGPRIGGTQSEKDAADYIAGVLDGYGYTVDLEPFAVADKFLGQLTGSPALPQDICWQVGASPSGALDVTVRADAVDVGDNPAAYAGDLTGKVVLVDAATAAQRNSRVPAAVARGAAAVVLLPADAADPIRRTSASSPTLSAATSVPVVAVAQVQKHRLREALAAGSLELTVETTAHRNLTSHNVLARRRGQLPTSTDRQVMVCAHYDSVIGAPGANDDGSGTGLCLELARVLRALPTRAEVSFALWGSEEQGLIGSRYHVRQLDQAKRDRLIGVFNNDMIATSWDPATRYWVLSFDGQPNIITSSVIGAAERLGYSPQLSPVTTRGASDHQSFQEVGIASANFSWRGEASPALLEPPYHSPEDTVAKNISMERMQVSLELIGAATYSVARDG